MLVAVRRGRKAVLAGPIAALLVAVWGVLGGSAALAADANSVPPHVLLLPAGKKNQESIIGRQEGNLAYFETEEPDQSWGYEPDSAVSFSCLVDGKGVPCGAHYEGCCSRQGAATASDNRPQAVPRKLQFGIGRFAGSVPVPRNLPSGPHVIQVTATDEDGTDSAPPSLTVMLDKTPPAAPQLTQVPPRRSRIHKPVFRFSASDGQQLVSRRENVFTAWLRRLNPPGVVYRSWSDGESFLNMWFARCPTLLTCSTRAQAAYMASEHWYSYGEPEWLVPGLYELRVRARDAVGNKSPLATYRFRILRGKTR
jgi:hypothetical protein